MIPLYNERMIEDPMELDDLLASLYAPTQLKWKITERDIVHNAVDVDFITRTDELDEERRKSKECYRNVHKYWANVSREASSREYFVLKTLIILIK